jgi:phage terminase large subunit
MTIPEKLLPFLTTKKRFKVAFGGRGACKSQSFADMLIMKSQVEGAKVGCFREYQNAIEDSVHALLVGEIERMKAPGYECGKTHIDNISGGGFRFKGLSRSAGSVKSMYGFKYFWVEEAQFLSKESLKLLTPTLREEDSECWFSLNTMSSADPISQRFIEPYREQLDRDGFYEDDLHLIIKINYTDNPWFPSNLEQERVHDFDTLPRAEYDHIWLGAYNDTVEGSIIAAEWFDAAVDAHIKLGFKPQGAKIVSFDPSDEGTDDKGLAVRHGSVVTDVDLMSNGDAADGMDWALEKALTENADLFLWDCDGLGVSLKRQVSDSLNSKHTKWSMFKGSEGVDRPEEIYEDTGKTAQENRKTNQEIFKNKRAQYYWAMRDRFFNTYRAVVKGEYINPDKTISISSDIKCLVALKSEVCRVPKKHNANGMIQIMSKPDMKRLKIKSPNLSDALMMGMRFDDKATSDIQSKARPAINWRAR